MNEEELFYDAEEEYCDPGTGASYSLHRAAFDENVAKLTALLQEYPPEQYSLLDLHGNNPLHIAALRGNTAAIQALLEAGLSPSARSSRGWTPLDEACACRSMAAARLLQRALLAEVKGEMKAKRAQLLETMRSMPDYSLQLKWQIGSSLPGLGMLLRRYAPHDTYTIWKVGDRLRVDGSLMGIDTKNIMPEWKRGHFSLVVDGSPAGVAAAAEAAAAAVAAASAAAEAKESARQRAAAEARENAQQQQQQQQSQTEQHELEAKCTDRLKAADAYAAEVAGSSGGQGSSDGSGSNSSSSSSTAQQADAANGCAVSSGNGHADIQQVRPSHNIISSSSDDRQRSEEEEEFHDVDEQQQQLASNGSSSSSGSSAAASPPAGPPSTAAAAAGPQGGGPRLLFLNHGKSSWVDLSADKKALKLEGRAEQEELEGELAAAMERDVDKLRVKPRQFKFTPVRGWLGGNMTEKVEGWKCTVYEATGKLLAVSTSKARLRLPKAATFDDYLAAEYEADEVTETLIDPLNPSTMGPGNSSNSSSKHNRDRSSHQGYNEKGSLTYGGGSSAADDSMGLGSDADFDALMWNEPSSSKKDKKATSKKASSSSEALAGAGSSAAAGGSSGRLLRARCWMAQDFPMQLSQLLPLLDVIGTANKHMAKVGKFLAKYSQMDMFPVKLQVPLLLTVYVLVSFKAFHPLLPGSSTPPPPPEFFEVPESYKRRLLADVMDKAAANMMGMGPGRGSSRGGSSGGGSCFYGGDEGEEGMFFGDDDAEDEDFLAGRDEELQREFERMREEREGGGSGGGGGGSSSSSSKKGGWRRKPKGRSGVFGSGLDADMQESSKW